MRIQNVTPELSRAHVSAAGPVPEIGEVVAQKPNARIAVVQGSFDWFHTGHLSLVSAVAQAKTPDGQPFDRVVVLPTWTYDRKPYLRDAFDRRVELARAAIEAVPALAGKVWVSSAMQPGNSNSSLPNGPAPMMQALCEAYPGAQFSYCLGGDSFDESADHQRWANFGYVENSPQIALLAVERGGHSIRTPHRADGVIKSDAVTISSSEIRRALHEGNLAAIADRVPPTTLSRLQQEKTRLDAHRSAGAKLLGTSSPSFKSFEALRAELPVGGVDLLDMIDMYQVPDDVRQHLANVQAQINAAAHKIDSLQFSVASKQMAKERGYSDKVMLNGAMGPATLSESYLHKPVGNTARARMIELTSVLANLLGIPTPLAMTHAFAQEGDTRAEKVGVSIKMIDALVEAKDYDMKKASPKVLEYLVLTRWLNDVLGNMDVWDGQILVPKDPKRRYDDLIAIDLDESFNRMPAEKLYDALINHFGLSTEQVKFDDCLWRDRPYEFAAPVGFSPTHFDGHMGYYSKLWRAYIQGEMDINLDAVKERMAFAGTIPREAILNCMQKFIEASASSHGGEGNTVHLPAAQPPTVARADFERLFVQRIETSIPQFCAFLDELKAARNNPDSEMAKFYKALKPRSY